jgi:endonuclease/exonuclease/phosphatase family metal-dependent hydrolase
VTASGDPREFPNTQPIFFRTERFEPLEQGFSFFSPTPEVIYSSPWAGRYPAFCSWARLRDRLSGQSFYVYNVHLDHSSLENRLKAARLVANAIGRRSHPEQPVVVLGDFNAPAAFRPVTILRDAGLTVAKRNGSTFHHYRGLHLLPAIDHVLFSPTLTFRETRVLRGRYDGVWPSDHYPVIVTLEIPAVGRQGG